MKLRLASFSENYWSSFEQGLEGIFVFEKAIFCHKKYSSLQYKVFGVDRL
jgi:hypothetical protein